MFISIEIELNVLLVTGYTLRCRSIICGKCIERWRWKWKEIDTQTLVRRRKLIEREKDTEPKTKK